MVTAWLGWTQKKVDSPPSWYQWLLFHFSFSVGGCHSNATWNCNAIKFNTIICRGTSIFINIPRLHALNQQNLLNVREEEHKCPAQNPDFSPQSHWTPLHELESLMHCRSAVALTSLLLLWINNHKCPNVTLQNLVQILHRKVELQKLL